MCWIGVYLAEDRSKRHKEGDAGSNGPSIDVVRGFITVYVPLKLEHLKGG